MAGPAGQRLIAESDIIQIDDSRAKEVTLSIFQSSKAHKAMQQLIEGAKAERLNLRITHTVTGSTTNIKRFARTVYKTLEKEIKEAGEEPSTCVHSDLSKSMESPNWQHLYQAYGKSCVMAKGELVVIGVAKVMQVSIPDKIDMEGNEWDLSEMAQKIKEDVSQLTGYPYILDVDITNQAVAPLEKDEKVNSKGKGKGKDHGKDQNRRHGKCEKRGRGKSSRK